MCTDQSGHPVQDGLEEPRIEQEVAARPVCRAVDSYGCSSAAVPLSTIPSSMIFTVSTRSERPGVAATGFVEPIELLDPAMSIPQERGRCPHREATGPVEVAVGPERGRVDRGVLPGCDSDLVEEGLGLQDRLDPVVVAHLGDQAPDEVDRRLVQDPGGQVSPSRSIRPSGGSGVASVIPASPSAMGLTSAECQARLRRKICRPTPSDPSQVASSLSSTIAPSAQPAPTIQGAFGCASAQRRIVSPYAARPPTSCRSACTRYNAPIGGCA